MYSMAHRRYRHCKICGKLALRVLCIRRTCQSCRSEIQKYKTRSYTPWEKTVFDEMCGICSSVMDTPNDFFYEWTPHGGVYKGFVIYQTLGELESKQPVCYGCAKFRDLEIYAPIKSACQQCATKLPSKRKLLQHAKTCLVQK